MIDNGAEFPLTGFPLEERLDRAIGQMLSGVGVAHQDGALPELMEVARALREMPSEEFEARLKSDLERRARMPALATRVREGFRTITPYLILEEGATFIAFLQHTFGAEEMSRTNAGGGYHAEVRIGDSMLMLWSSPGLKGREKIGVFHVYVDDCDAAYARALEAGAESLDPPSDRPYGERLGGVKDFAGNTWYIATRKPGTPVVEGSGSVNPYVHPAKAREYIGFLKTAFGAAELFVVEHDGHVMHAAVRIGDAILEMGESGKPPELGRFFLYVDDCDAWYERALAAGAKPVQAPADQFHHHRTAVVEDPLGQEWVTATLLR